MMGWLFILMMGGALLVALWRVARLDRSGLQFVASAVLLALSGYAWQGSPGLAGMPKRSAAREPLPDTGIAEMRRTMLGHFDTADRWLTIADGFERRGDTRNAVGVIGSAIHAHPDNATLWVGLGNALVLHADGLMTPAAQLAFRRAAALAPDHPGPKFFYGLALAQSGQLDQADRVWTDLLASAPPDASWRPEVERQLDLLRQAKAMQGR